VGGAGGRASGHRASRRSSVVLDSDGEVTVLTGAASDGVDARMG
jgi:hypothetical protein